MSPQGSRLRGLYGDQVDRCQRALLCVAPTPYDPTAHPCCNPTVQALAFP